MKHTPTPWRIEYNNCHDELVAMTEHFIRREREVLGSAGSPFAVDEALIAKAEAILAKAKDLHTSPNSPLT